MDNVDDPVVVPTWALVAATVALVVATLVLPRFAFLQWRAATDASEQSKRQAELAAESLDVSLRLLRATEEERKAAAPLELAIELREHVAGHALFAVRNASETAAMRLERIKIVDLPTESVHLDQSLAEGTLGVSDDSWNIEVSWDASRVGQTLACRLTGHRIGGPQMTIEYRYRVDEDGRLIDLQTLVPQIC